jgi:ribosomal protein S27E
LIIRKSINKRSVPFLRSHFFIFTHYYFENGTIIKVEQGRFSIMSLINCPDCGNECSSTAVACPNCGHPFAKAAVQPKVIVKEVPRKESFPKWIFIPLALLGATILFVVFTMLNRDDTTEQRNINVNISSRSPDRVQTTTSNISTTSLPSTVTVPSTSQPSTITVPSTTTTVDQPSTVTSVPSNPGSTIVETGLTDKGSVRIEAKIMSDAEAHHSRLLKKSFICSTKIWKAYCLKLKSKMGDRV